MVDLPKVATGVGARVELRDVGKRFGEVEALRGFELEVGPGEIVAFLGPSGCGKTTALRIVAGLEQPSTGSVAFDGVDVTDVPSRQRRATLVFQDYALFPHMTVAQNVAFGLRATGTPAAERQPRVASALELVRLSGFEERRPSQLSGGQRQRVAIARALAVDPVVLLLDEPLAALDRQLREAMQLELRTLIKSTGVTALFVTHDQDEAMTLADRVVVMDAGRIAQVGTSEEIYHRPATLFVARFVGQASVLPIDGLGSDAHVRIGDTTVAVVPQPGQAYAVLRPEQTYLLGPDEEAPADCEIVVPGVVSGYQYAGPSVIATVRCGTQTLFATPSQRAADKRPADGTAVTVGFSVASLWPVPGQDGPAG